MTPPGTACSVCERTFTPTPSEPWRCPCGAPLEFEIVADLPSTPPAPDDLDRDAGLWAFADLIPVDAHVTLGEGDTPLVDAPAWNSSFKLEYVSPTGSFKDRGSTTTISRALALGVDRIVDDSSGNAGAAIATYAARAGLPADIYVPAGVKPAKLAAIERTGARAIRIEGSREAVTDACVAAVEDGSAWYASHAWNPAFFAGTMTVAFEIARQYDWSVPDAFVSPVGHGTMLLGAYRGFVKMHDMGWTDDIPRIYGVQAAGYDPLATADGGAVAGTNELADGVQIERPARRDQLLAAVRATDGRIISLETEPVREALDRLHRDGFYVEPTSALAPAALDRLRETGDLDGTDDVVVPLTGSGLKMAN